MYGDNMLEEDVTEKADKSICEIPQILHYKPGLKHKLSLKYKPSTVSLKVYNKVSY